MRLIDADVLYKYLDSMSWTEYKKYNVLEAINETPTVDAEPVVRCKNCRYYSKDIWGEIHGVKVIVAHEGCRYWGTELTKVTDNSYCSNGKPVDEDETTGGCEGCIYITKDVTEEPCNSCTRCCTDNYKTTD